MGSYTHLEQEERRGGKSRRTERKMFAFIFLVAAILAQVKGSYVPVYQPAVTSTVYETQYATHACYHTVTSDVIVPVRTAVTSVVVQYATLRDFEEEYGNTRVSVVTVTDTQVDVRTREIQQNLERTVVATVTDFVTRTATRNVYSTITHIDVRHNVRTVPVYNTVTVHQAIEDTTTAFVTVTVTSTTQAPGYY